MEAPEGFRNSDEDHFSESQVNEESGASSVKGVSCENCVGEKNACFFSQQESSVEDVQDLRDLEMPEEQQESAEEKGDEPHGETKFDSDGNLIA